MRGERHWLEAGCWKLEAGSWRLEAGFTPPDLDVRSEKLEAGIAFANSNFQPLASYI